LQIVARNPSKTKWAILEKLLLTYSASRLMATKFGTSLPAAMIAVMRRPSSSCCLARAEQRSLIGPQDPAFRVYHREMTDEKIGLRTLASARYANNGHRLHLGNGRMACVVWHHRLIRDRPTFDVSRSHRSRASSS